MDGATNVSEGNTRITLALVRPFARLVLLTAAVLLLPVETNAQVRSASADGNVAEVLDAAELNSQVLQLFGQGRYAEAVPLAQRGLAIVEKAHGPEHPDTGTRLNNLAELYRALGRYDDALPLYTRALAVSEKAHGPEHLVTGIRLNNLGSLYRAMGRYDSVLPLYVRALAIFEKARGPEHLDTGTSLSSLASLYQDMGRHDQALPLFTRALAISEKAQGPEHPVTGVRLNNLASLYQAMGRDDRALPLYTRALAISELAEGPEHAVTGRRLNNLANLHHNMGRYDQALALYTRALAISEKALGPQHPDTGIRLNNLAELYRDMGLYEQALPLYTRALAISELVQGPEHRATGIRLNNLAELYRDMGLYEQALPLYARALAIFESALGPGHPDTGVSLSSLASTYRNMGRYDQALPLFTRALGISEQALGPEHPATGTSLNNLAVLFQDMGRYDQALPLYARALAISEQTQGPKHPDTASRLSNLALLHHRMGRSSRALPLLARALAISEMAQGPEHPATGTHLNNLGLIHNAMGRNGEALPILTRALAISETAHGPEHPDTGRSLNNLAVVYWQQGRRNEATRLWQRALPITSRGDLPELAWSVQDWLSLALTNAAPSVAIFWGKQSVNTIQTLRANLASLDRETQQSFLRNKRGAYTGLADLLVTHGRLAEAEQVLALLKEQESFELLRRTADGAERPQADYVGPAERAAALEYEALSRQALARATELQALSRLHSSIRTPEQTARLRELQDQAQVWNQGFQSWLTRLSASFAADEANRQARRQQVQDESTQMQRLLAKAGDSTTVGLHYVLTDKQLSVIVSTSRASAGRRFAVDSAALNRQIAQLRQALQDPKLDPRPAAQALYDVLVKPLEPDLHAAGATTLVFSLTGNIRYIPFAALHDGQQWLVQRLALAQVTLAALPTAASATPWRVAGMGTTRAHTGFSALPAVRQELAGIVQATGNNGVLPGSISLDEAFTRERLEDTLAERYPVLHIGSHFVFRPGDESRSFLLLGDGNRMTLGQLAQLDFEGVQLLALSACDTASGGGHNEYGAEVEGLATIVVKRGAKSVLASLWPVADESTAQLMRGFYLARLGGTGAQAAAGAGNPTGRARALQQAQLRLMSSGPVTANPQPERGASRADKRQDRSPVWPADPKQPYAHPYFWAPFVLMGSWS